MIGLDVVVHLSPLIRPRNTWARLLEPGAIEFIRLGSVLECQRVPGDHRLDDRHCSCLLCSRAGERIGIVDIFPLGHQFYLKFVRGVAGSGKTRSWHDRRCDWRLLDDRSATSSGWTPEFPTP